MTTTFFCQTVQKQKTSFVQTFFESPYPPKNDYFQKQFIGNPYTTKKTPEIDIQLFL